jgi:hypothetical protein
VLHNCLRNRNPPYHYHECSLYAGRKNRNRRIWRQRQHRSRVLKTLNERYDYGLDLILLSIDEGIKGYRDDSLETVKRNAEQYGMDLTILGYDELYGWTMDQVVEQVGKKGNCTYCGVFRRQALDRGAARLGVKHVVTGHNADDVAETVLMNCESCCYLFNLELGRS